MVKESCFVINKTGLFCRYASDIVGGYECVLPQLLHGLQMKQLMAARKSRRVKFSFSEVTCVGCLLRKVVVMR
jgi:hypothetical protein